MAKACPCTSGLPYAGCCAPLHRGAREAATPEALMRSRFAAFAVGDAEYLWRTLHPEHEDRVTDRAALLRSLRDSARALKFMRLTVLEARGPQVLFLARVFEKGQDRSFLELSTFARTAEGWRYLAGQARPAGDPAPAVPAGEGAGAGGWTIASFEASEASRDADPA